MENAVFNKILTENGSSIRVYITVSEHSIQLIVLQNKSAWKCSVKKEDLEFLAKEHNLNMDHYCNQLLEYVQTPIYRDLVFHLNEEFVINRVLKKLKVKFFTCKLEKADYTTQVEEIMDLFYLRSSEMSKKFDNLMKEKNEADECKARCELKLKELVKRKVEEDSEQFGHFMLVLNEKKRHIQHLTEILEAFKKGRPCVNPTVEVQKKGSKRKIQESVSIRKKEVLSDSEPSENSETEDICTTDEESKTGESSKNYSSAKDKENPYTKDKENPSASNTFDFLEDDFPRSHILPKRIKSSSPVGDVVVIHQKPSTEEARENTEVKKAERRKTPEIDLSTQQLLDML